MKTKKRIFKLIGLVGLGIINLTFASCKTKVNADGIVFSKHHIPIPGAFVTFYYSVGGRSSVVGSIDAKTNSDGKFIFANKSTGHANSTIEQVHAAFPDSGAVTLDRGQFAVGPNMEIQLR